MITFDVIEGDATQVPCDALVTCINSEKVWFGGLDGAIQRAAGGIFHAVPARMDLQDGMMIWAGAPMSSVTRPFNAVLFIVDDLHQPIRDLVESAIATAVHHGARHIVIPGLRTGVMLDIAPEGSEEAIVNGIVGGARDFEERRPDTDLKITFATFRAPHLTRLFEAATGKVV